MYKVSRTAKPHISMIAALFVLLNAGAIADGYQPMPGSFRALPPSGSSEPGTGFRQDNSQVITAPSQQQAWTTQPYAGSPNYYLPPPQPAPEYRSYDQQDSTRRHSFNIHPGSFVNDMFGFRSNRDSNRPSANYQAPVYQPPVMQAPINPQQYYYGSSYPHPRQQQQAYDYATPPAPAPTSATAPQPQEQQQPSRFSNRPFSGQNNRFRPPELKGTE